MLEIGRHNPAHETDTAGFKNQLLLPVPIYRDTEHVGEIFKISNRLFHVFKSEAIYGMY